MFSFNLEFHPNNLSQLHLFSMACGLFPHGNKRKAYLPSIIRPNVQLHTYQKPELPKDSASVCWDIDFISNVTSGIIGTRQP